MSNFKIKCICIDDTGKPIPIPQTHWVKKGEPYTINHIWCMMNQKQIQGATIDEIDISQFKPFNCFKLSRFSFTQSELDKLVQMMKDCTELNDSDISELVEVLELVEEEEEW